MKAVSEEIVCLSSLSKGTWVEAGIFFLANRKWVGVGVPRYKAEIGPQPLPFSEINQFHVLSHWPRLARHLKGLRMSTE